MSNRCMSETCLNGNCPGCKNGEKYCEDPRCYPDCPDCSGETKLYCLGGRTGWDWTLIIIIGVLVLLVLVLFIVMGVRWRSQKTTTEAVIIPDQTTQLPQMNQTQMAQPQIQVTTAPVRAAVVPRGMNPPAIDSALNVPEPVINAARPITQTSFTQSIDGIPQFSVPPAGNVSVGYARPMASEALFPPQRNSDIIRGFT